MIDLKVLCKQLVRETPMKVFYLLFFISLMKPGMAAVKSPWLNFDNQSCQREFLGYLAKNNWDKEEFLQQVGGSYKELVYRNISKIIGEWVELHQTKGKSAEIITLINQKMSRVSFNSSCEVAIKDEPMPWFLEKVFNKKTPDDWGDAELIKTLSSNEKGIIYLWSPRFAYSVFDLPRVETLAKQLGYYFIPVVDPRASSEEVRAALEILNEKKFQKNSRNLASKFSINRNVSMDIFMRNGFNHFPVTFVFNNKKIHPRFITGVMTNEDSKKLFETFSNELKGNK